MPPRCSSPSLRKNSGIKAKNIRNGNPAAGHDSHSRSPDKTLNKSKIDFFMPIVKGFMMAVIIVFLRKAKIIKKSMVIKNAAKPYLTSISGSFLITLEC